MRMCWCCSRRPCERGNQPHRTLSRCLPRTYRPRLAIVGLHPASPRLASFIQPIKLKPEAISLARGTIGLVTSCSTPPVQHNSRLSHPSHWPFVDPPIPPPLRNGSTKIELESIIILQEAQSPFKTADPTCSNTGQHTAAALALSLAKVGADRVIRRGEIGY
jgi:hypothetical protein